jgi:hypothetical protein
MLSSELTWGLVLVLLALAKQLKKSELRINSLPKNKMSLNVKRTF